MCAFFSPETKKNYNQNISCKYLLNQATSRKSEYKNTAIDECYDQKKNKLLN